MPNDYIDQYVTPDNSSYPFIAKTGRGLVRATMDATNSTATAFVINADGITSLYDGLTIVVNNNKAESKTGCTLELNQLGAKRIWLSQNNSYCTNHWGLDVTYIFIYDEGNNRWELQQGRNTDTLPTQGARMIAGTNGLFKYVLSLKVSYDTWESVVLSSTTGTSKTKNSSGFLISSPMVYSPDTYASGTTSGASSYAMYHSLDSRYSANVNTSWSSTGKSFYLVGTITGDKFYLADTWWADALPSTADGKYYWYVGQMYSAYNYELNSYHPMYYHDGTGIKLFTPDMPTKTSDLTNDSNFIATGDNASLTSLSTTNTVSAQSDITTHTEYQIKADGVDISQSDNNISENKRYSLCVYDDAEITMPFTEFTGFANTDGTTGYGLYAINSIGSSQNTMSGVSLKLNKSGNTTVTFTNAEAWRKGLKVMIPKNIWSDSIAATSVPNNSATTLTSITLAPGRYLVMLWARFKSHADTGYRYIFLTESSTGTSPIELIAEKQIGANGSNISYSLDITMALNNNTSSNKTYYFRAWHNGGTPIEVTPRYHIIKLSEVS